MDRMLNAGVFFVSVFLCLGLSVKDKPIPKELILPKGVHVFTRQQIVDDFEMMRRIAEILGAKMIPKVEVIFTLEKGETVSMNNGSFRVYTQPYRNFWLHEFGHFFRTTIPDGRMAKTGTYVWEEFYLEVLEAVAADYEPWQIEKMEMTDEIVH